MSDLGPLALKRASSRPLDFWSDVLPNAVPREGKPRKIGLTMLLDRTLTLESSKELVRFVGTYVDIVKLSFGTAALIDPETLQEKISVLKSGAIDVMPGGTLFEMAFQNGTQKAFFRKIQKLGFNRVEISDGSIMIPLGDRESCIKLALDSGLKVVTEVGKKDPRQQPSMNELSRTAIRDLELGASHVIIEARESGKEIGIFDEKGHLKENSFNELLADFPKPERLIWEAPMKDQQAMLIRKFGPNVSLGNIAPDDVLGLEGLRCGLRWDTSELMIQPKRSK